MATNKLEKLRQIEGTKRHQIDAQLIVALSKIQAQKDVMMECLDRSFNERKENFDQLWEMVENGDRQSINTGMETIVRIGTSPPMEMAVASIVQVGTPMQLSVGSVRNILKDPNQQFEF